MVESFKNRSTGQLIYQTLDVIDFKAVDLILKVE